MIVLAVETAGPRPGAALATEDGLLDEEVVQAGARPGKHFVPVLDQLLRRRGLDVRSVDLYAVDVGPGSFTGIRVGLATVKALALVHPRPAIAVSSLEATAWACLSGGEDVVPILHANRDLYYTARFSLRDGRLERLKKDSLVCSSELAMVVGGGERPARLIGPGLARLPLDVRRALESVGRVEPSDDERVPAVSSVAAIALERFRMGLGVAPHALRPVYLQSPY